MSERNRTPTTAKVLRGLALVVLIGATLMVALHVREPSPAALGSSPPSPSPSRAIEGIKRLELAKTAEVVRQIGEALGSGESPDDSSFAIHTFEMALQEFSRLRRSPFMVDQQRLIVEALASDEAIQTHSVRALTESGYARDFSANQAEARLLAVRVLGEALRQGARDPLLSAVGKLSTEAVTSGLTKGRERDLEDLVREYVAVVGEAALEHPDEVLDTLGFQDAGALVRPYVAGFYFALAPHHPKAAIEAALRGSRIGHHM